MIGATSTNSKSKQDGVIIITDRRGNLVQQEMVALKGVTWINDLIQLSEGDYILVGSDNSGTDSAKPLLLRVDINGKVLWTKTVRAAECNAGISVTTDNDEALYFVGFKTVGSTDNDRCLTKTTIDGRVLFSGSYDNSGWSNVDDVIVTQKGEVILSGFAQDENEDNGNNSWLASFDSEGNNLWSKIYFGPKTGMNRAFSVEENPDGSLAVGGIASVNGARRTATLFQLNAEQTVTEQFYFGASSNSEIRSITRVEDNSYILTGRVPWFEDYENGRFIDGYLPDGQRTNSTMVVMKTIPMP